MLLVRRTTTTDGCGSIGELHPPLNRFVIPYHKMYARCNCSAMLWTIASFIGDVKVGLSLGIPLAVYQDREVENWLNLMPLKGRGKSFSVLFMFILSIR